MTRSEMVDRLGLCSVTLRAISAEAVIEAAVRAGLKAVEWGADVHAPPAEHDVLQRVRELSDKRGVRVCSYGSYWKAGVEPIARAREVIEAAGVLGAPRVRIWAGVVGTAVADEDVWRRTVAAIREAATTARDAGIEVAMEFHPGTLTDTAGSTLRLLERVASPNVSTYWQPLIDETADEAIAGLGAVVDVVSAVHVFSWWPGYDRLPLVDREDLWRPALDLLAARNPAADLLMEFVPGDDPEVLVSEAQTLRTWVVEAAQSR